jgi:alpha-D-ribose 1-methylphosphonate 5-phosphate C-P lyase
MTAAGARSETAGYGFGFLDEDAKREIRRALLKAVAVPGYQVPYASREMPIARGFGTGGLQITLSILGPGDVVKVIDQGSDDSVNANNLRRFFSRTCPGVSATTATQDATIIQTRHRIPEQPLADGQILVLQVPYPDPLVIVEPSQRKRRTMHGEGDYARLWVKLYEDMIRFSDITISHRYPTRIADHYVIDPSPIPRFDVPKLGMSKGLFLFGAGREKRIYAVPPYTSAVPLSFSDVPFRVEAFLDEKRQRRRCVTCGSATSFLDEVPDGRGAKVFQCSDSDHCEQSLRRRGAS